MSEWKAVADDTLSVVRIFESGVQCGYLGFDDTRLSKAFADQVNRGALLAQLTEDEINAINWSKVPELMEACKGFIKDWDDAYEPCDIPSVDDIEQALAAVERK